MNKVVLLGLLTASLSAQAEWEFRGTPNDWQTTAMEQISSTQFETCQTFGTNDPRFKIDRWGNWQEAYPNSDYRVASGSYLITFYSDSKYIELSSVASCDSNQAPTAVISPGTAQTVEAGTSITFSASGSSDADGSIAATAGAPEKPANLLPLVSMPVKPSRYRLPTMKVPAAILPA